jgi:hypothetical protein
MPESVSYQEMCRIVKEYCKGHSCPVYALVDGSKCLIDRSKRLSGDCEIDEYCFGPDNQDGPTVWWKMEEVYRKLREM